MARTPNPLGHITGTSRPRGESAKFRPGKPYAPKDMPEEAKSIWRFLMGLIGDTGILDEGDRYALQLLCHTWAMWRRAQREFEAEPVTTGSRGNLVKSPWGDIANTEAERLRKLLVEFGLTPAARVKLGALQQETPMDKELAEILGG